MLPDIRVVVTAIATTVLILVGIGLMASIRITHQGLSGGSVVASSHTDATLGSRLTWRPVPEQVISLPHETVDLTALAAEEKDLAERILAIRSQPSYLLAAEPTVDESIQIAALLAREQEVPTGSASFAAADPTPTASITPAPNAATITPPTASPAKKIAAVGVTAKAAAKGRPRVATTRAGRTARARAARSAADKGVLETLFGLDQIH
jgi:hypothetical protein